MSRSEPSNAIGTSREPGSTVSLQRLRTMTPDQWEILKEHFDVALNLSGDERKHFLNSIRSQEAALAAELTKLLEQHEAAKTFLEGNDTVPAGSFVPDQLVGGRYRVIRQLGRGGMGEVYEAIDSEIDERIALKTLR